MKIKLLLSAIAIFMTMTAAYASFPVKRASVTTENTITTDISQEDVLEAIPAASSGKDKWVAAALWFVLGWPFAAHRWYLGSPWYWNVLFIITFAGIGVWAIVDIINILTDNWDGL
ncbi:MAG: S-adenosyl-L-homocysteine hydrolase [Flavobacteriaceae bacterium]|uniref:TM2 domain-containing protein n=1 Tax=Winogradskyella sp. SYSU M77433 TaxID=3042722 RepID=UPI000C35708B|nr:TM2 domain-containing protein [Winogradskyella sp. SYSU M77433]MAX70968.1 S-adenosyl-L-homocysteine hydrolase [Flavobacteriaceae bacterium]MDH7912716.1 TM2 domain-containing protein [Winogradskyella sp. SYSU M77433]|tara:strand:- start:820 stop:1167 length:348 start_codon:yes stop_codon:yes gene_type:complete